MRIFFIQRKQVVLCNCNSYKLLLLNHWIGWFWITLLVMCHWGKPLLHALVKYKSLTNSHGNKPNFVWKILPLWKWASPVPICSAWPPPPCQKELAQAKLLVCPHSVSSAVHGERGGLSPPAVIGNPWAPCDLEMLVGALAHANIHPIHCSIAGRELEEVVSIFLYYPCDHFDESCPCPLLNCSSKNHELALRGWALECSQVWEPSPQSVPRKHKHCNLGNRNQWQKLSQASARGEDLTWRPEQTLLTRQRFQSLSWTH